MESVTQTREKDWKFLTVIFTVQIFFLSVKVQPVHRGNFGVINYREENRIGTICGNSQYGIRGQMEPGKYTESMKKIPTGLKQEIQTGKAEIRCDIGDGIREYQCEILEIDSNARDTNKCFVLRITDDDLLSRTGGIVQGMSGSPVLQNGKLIGAITHVFVNDPTKGYGIFIENMME